MAIDQHLFALECVMNHTDEQPAPSAVQSVADLYQKAAYELLQAYQRNKEATRHQADGAFRAALHHAHCACAHSSAAHAHLTLALQQLLDMAKVPQVSNCSTSLMADRRDH